MGVSFKKISFTNPSIDCKYIFLESGNSGIYHYVETVNFSNSIYNGKGDLWYGRSRIVSGSILFIEHKQQWLDLALIQRPMVKIWDVTCTSTSVKNEAAKFYKREFGDWFVILADSKAYYLHFDANNIRLEYAVLQPVLYIIPSTRYNEPMALSDRRSVDIESTFHPIKRLQNDNYHVVTTGKLLRLSKKNGRLSISIDSDLEDAVKLVFIDRDTLKVIYGYENFFILKRRNDGMFLFDQKRVSFVEASSRNGDCFPSEDNISGNEGVIFPNKIPGRRSNKFQWSLFVMLGILIAFLLFNHAVSLYGHGMFLLQRGRAH